MAETDVPQLETPTASAEAASATAEPATAAPAAPEPASVAAAADAAEAPAAPAAARSASAPGPMVDARILLVDDSPSNQQLIAFFLQKAGATVTIADNGRTACEAVQQAAGSGQPFDMVLMDMQMPELNGYGATSRIRAQG